MHPCAQALRLPLQKGGKSGAVSDCSDPPFPAAHPTVSPRLFLEAQLPKPFREQTEMHSPRAAVFMIFVSKWDSPVEYLPSSHATFHPPGP